ncbi:unnamed protein product [Trichobilharzia szidati]|nr:unnamed protein product [Trichobilharzia szidati]
MGWRVYIKPVFVVCYALLICSTLPFLILKLYEKSAPAIVSAWFVAGLFVLGAIPISLWTIIEHVINYTKPFLQRHIIRILWMVPIYAIDAWMALIFPKYAIYFDTLRECYEAYVVYNFLAFLLNYLKSQYPDLGHVVKQKPQVKHLPPFCFLKSWEMGRRFIDHCRHGALQYTVIRPLTTAVALICEILGVYGEGDFNFHHAFLYLTIINNISQIWALYCLVLFYRCARQELKPMKPVAKFLCVKFVIFMSFWQSILIAVLAATGLIRKVEAWKLYDVRSIGIALQNFAICIEMFIAAIAHHFSFSSAPFVDPDAPTTGCCQSWWSMWDVSDMRHDVVEHVRHIGHSVRRFNLSSDRQSTNRRSRGCPYNPNLSCEDRRNTDTSNNMISFESESSPLLPHEEITSVEVVAATTTTTTAITPTNTASLTTSECI